MELRKDELILIEMLRAAPKYCTFTVEKRPTAEYPDGELNRIVMEQSFLVRDMTPANFEGSGPRNGRMVPTGNPSGSGPA